MNFICNKNDLEYALNLATRAVASKSVNSILECVLLTVENNSGFSLIGNDREISINTTPIPAEIKSEGSIALNAKLFHDIVKKLPGSQVDIEVDDRFKTTIKSGRSALSMLGLSPYDFPTIVEEELINGKPPHKIKSSILKDMIRQTIFSVSNDPSKIVQTGELFEIKDSSLQIVAIDMFRISYRLEKLLNDASDTKAVIPSKALHELTRLISNEKDEEIEFYFTDKKAVFLTEEYRMAINLLHGDFIRYDQIFNEDFSTYVTINREQFLQACERVLLLSVEGKPISMKLEISNDDLSVSAASERGNVNDGVPCMTEGKELTIYFNPRYFSDVLRVVETEKVNLKFNSVMSPCTITLEGYAGFKYLIVPLRPPL